MRNLVLAGMFVVGGALAAVPGAVAQGKHVAGGVVIAHTEINIGMVAEGWSVVQLLRGQVINEKNEFIGYVHDAIVTPQGETSYVIVNVAGYLGIPTKLVAIPANAFEVTVKKNLRLPNATKDMLMKLPEFQYNPS